MFSSAESFGTEMVKALKKKFVLGQKEGHCAYA
jgi:hypothetical protein